MFLYVNAGLTMSKSQITNKIEPFQVDFEDNRGQKISAQSQANKIIAEFNRRLNVDPNAKVAITYSANNDQVEEIIRGYTTGQYSISGSNQAEVIRIVIEEIKKRGWQDKAHILPIATSQHSGGDGVIRMDQVDRDLGNIAQHLGAGWQVLGYRNQKTNQQDAYAIGGGVSNAVWKGNIQQRVDEQMRKMTQGDFSDAVLSQAFQKGESNGVALMHAAKSTTTNTQNARSQNKSKQSIPIISVSVGAVKGIAPFKDNIPPYGAFANTTLKGDFSIKQELIINGKSTTMKWPSSENAYHAQKIIAYRDSLKKEDEKIKILDKMLIELAELPHSPQRIFLPKSDDPMDPNTFEGLVNRNLKKLKLNSKKEFDALCKADYHPKYNPNASLNAETGLPYNYDYMKITIAMKLEQYPDLKELAKEFARNGVMPMEISRKDQTWASFENGEGNNYLGIIILELGNHYLKKEENIDPPPIMNPHEAYKKMQRSMPGEFGYNQLKKYVNNNNGKAFAPLPDVIKSYTEELEIQKSYDKEKPGESSLQTKNILFSKITEAEKTNDFHSSVNLRLEEPEAQKSYEEKKTREPWLKTKDVLSSKITETEKTKHFQQPKNRGFLKNILVFIADLFNVASQGDKNKNIKSNADAPQDTFVQQSRHVKYPEKSESQQTHHQLFRTKNVLFSQSHQPQKNNQSKIPGSKTAIERVMDATKAISVSMIEDKEERKIRLEFENDSEAQQFLEKFKDVQREGIQKDRNIFFLGRAAADLIFKELNINTHGKTKKYPMFDSLEHEIKNMQEKKRTRPK